MKRAVAFLVLIAVLLAPAVIAESPPIGAGFEVARRDETYLIEAPNRSALMEVLADLRHEQGWIGLTTLAYVQRVEVVPDAKTGCRLDGLHLRLDVVVKTPVLSDASATRSRSLQRIWHPMIENLRRHEEGHAALAISEARASYERLAAAGPFPDCRAARRALLRESLRIRQRQAFVHAHYDRVTRFGTRQAAWTRTPETPDTAGTD